MIPTSRTGALLMLAIAFAGPAMAHEHPVSHRHIGDLSTLVMAILGMIVVYGLYRTISQPRRVKVKTAHRKKQK